MLEFTKKYWQLVLLALLVAAFFFMFERQKKEFANKIQEINAINQREIDKITQVRSLEDEQHAKELKELNEKLNAIQSDYDEAQKNLAKKQDADVRQVLKTYGNDMDALANQLATKFGLVVLGSAQPTKSFYK
jgi:uncharacterized membrane protein YgaE (UPF0421/DUF939 family)